MSNKPEIRSQIGSLTSHIIISGTANTVDETEAWSRLFREILQTADRTALIQILEIHKRDLEGWKYDFNAHDRAVGRDSRLERLNEVKQLLSALNADNETEA